MIKKAINMIHVIKEKVSTRAKHLFIAGMSVVTVGVAGFASSPLLTGSWSTFLTSMKSFFESGLGGPGMEGIGIAIAAIGITSAIISFVVHKFNPQSRMPGWITCLVIGLFGVIAMSGIAKPLGLLKQARDLLFSWVGL